MNTPLPIELNYLSKNKWIIYKFIRIIIHNQKQMLLNLKSKLKKEIPLNFF